MPKILSVKQLYEADKSTVEKLGISISDLMEHVGTLCFQWMHQRLKGDQVNIKVFCGTGNNGGDGLVIARHLKQHGYNVQTFVINCSNKRSEVFLAKYDQLKDIGVWPEMVTCETEIPEITENDMIVDAIFGIGLSRNPEDVIKKVIEHINASNAYILSIDIPSGLYPEQAVTDHDAVIKAYHTLTFQSPKMAFILPDNKAYINSWEVIDIGLDPEYMFNAPTSNFLMTKPDVLPIFKFREKFSHKGSFGHSLIIGGSQGKIGAVSLAAKAALNIGSGLVTALIPEIGYQIVQTSLPEVMVEVDGQVEIENFKYTSEATVIGIGVGMGTSDKTVEGFKKFLKVNKVPLVLDADALNILAKHKTLLKLLPENSILTPHPKEFERLVGKWSDDYDKLEKLKNFSTKHKVIVILKGAFSAIALQDRLYFNSTGNPALATAGSGDVLTGFITGLSAQDYSPLEAAIIGVFLHGRTADVAMKEMVYETFTATDCINYLPIAFMDLFKKEAPPQAVQGQNQAQSDKASS